MIAVALMSESPTSERRCGHTILLCDERGAPAGNRALFVVALMALIPREETTLCGKRFRFVTNVN